MALFNILTKVSDGRKIAINSDDIKMMEDFEEYTLICLIDGDEFEVEESIDDIFPNSGTPKQRDKKTPFIPIKLSSN
jgi:uncharacterized protein YlzI (FlbEa/FlbD family)